MVDLTVAAVPFYFGSMEAERRWLRARAGERGPTSADYEKRDTIANLSMGTLSLVAPFVAGPVRRALSVRTGRWGKPVLAVAVGAAAATTVADAVRRRAARRGEPRSRPARVARAVAGAGGVTAITAGVL